MRVDFTAEQSDAIRRAIESGRIRRADEAVRAAIVLWIERERRRGELLGALDDAETSLARGEGIDLTQAAMTELAADVKRRGRARLAVRPPG